MIKKIITRVLNSIRHRIFFYIFNRIEFPKYITTIRLNKDNKKTLPSNDNDYWATVARNINREFFLDMGNFLKKKIIMDHLAHPDFFLGESIISRLKQSEYGKMLLARIQDSPVGSPYLIPSYPLLSPTTASHLANLCEIKEKLNIDLISKHSHFVDFGGGYGGLSRCVLNLNISNTVSIIDLHEMLEIQTEFLKLSVSNPDHRVIFQDTATIATSKVNVTVFNASFSLSEISSSQREIVVEYIRNRVENFMILYQAKFNNTENTKAFSEIQDRLSEQFDVNTDKYLWFSRRNDVSVLYGKRRVVRAEVGVK
jgi:hypothetical protein